MIEEYEASLVKRTEERQQAERRAKEASEKYKKAKETLEQNTITGNFSCNRPLLRDVVVVVLKLHDIMRPIRNN